MPADKGILGGGFRVGAMPQRRGAASQIWLISFCDLVGCLLAFFVMIFSMTRMEGPQLIAAAETSPQIPASSAQGGMDSMPTDTGRDLAYLARLLRQQIAAEPGLAEVTVGDAGGRLLLTLPETLLVEAQGADQSTPAMLALSRMMENLPNRIEVEGTVTPSTDASEAPEGHWQAALTLGLSVQRALQEAGYPRPITVRGRVLASAAPRGEGDVARRWVRILVHQSTDETL